MRTKSNIFVSYSKSNNYPTFLSEEERADSEM